MDGEERWGEKLSIVLSKKTLKLEQEFDVSLIGIASSLKDYKIAHFISKILNQDFIKQLDLEWKHPKQDKPQYFSNYRISIIENDDSIVLIHNRDLGIHFLPSLKEFDYILLWNPSISTEELGDYLSRIKNMPEILEASRIQISWIKELDRLNWFLS